MRFSGINKKWLAVLFFMGLMILLGTRWIGPGVGSDSPAHLAEISERDFDIMIKTIGVLDAARSHMLSSTIKGDKGKIVFLVEDGTHVKEGDVLVKLDASPFEEEIHQLEGELVRLTAALDANKQALEWEKNQVDREIKTAEFNLQVAKLEHDQLVEGDGPIKMNQLKTDMLKIKEELDKYASYVLELEKLQQEGYDYRTEIALAKGKTDELKEKLTAAESNYSSYQNHVFPSLMETAKAKIKNAEMEHAQTQNGSVYKIAKAHSAYNETKGIIDSTEAALTRARRELEKTVVAAPYSGIAILFETFRDGQKRKPRVGDKVWENQPLLYLPDISSMVVKTQVREIDLHKIFLSQPCTIRVDAYPEVSFQGEVMYIGVLATDRYDGGPGEKYFEVSIAVKGSDMRLRPGMTARAVLINEQLTNVLAVPVQAVFNEGMGKSCYRFHRGRFTKTPVTLGRQNEDFAEILSGLKKGDRVSLIQPRPGDIH